MNYLLITPPSHFTLQGAKGYGDGFTWLRGITTIKKYSYENL